MRAIHKVRLLGLNVKTVTDSMTTGMADTFHQIRTHLMEVERLKSTLVMSPSSAASAETKTILDSVLVINPQHYACLHRDGDKLAAKTATRDHGIDGARFTDVLLQQLALLIASIISDGRVKHFAVGKTSAGPVSVTNGIPSVFGSTVLTRSSELVKLLFLFSYYFVVRLQRIWLL